MRLSEPVAAPEGNRSVQEFGVVNPVRNFSGALNPALPTGRQTELF